LGALEGMPETDYWMARPATKKSRIKRCRPPIDPELLLLIEFRRISLFFRQGFVTSRSGIVTLAASGWLKQEVIPKYRLAIPTQRTYENKRELRPRRRDFNGERAAETCFTILTIVIFGVIVGISAYAVLSVIPKFQRYQTPEWQRAHSPLNLVNSNGVESQTHSSGLK
jgi:hypothetical protein